MGALVFFDVLSVFLVLVDRFAFAARRDRDRDRGRERGRERVP
ncbi:MAG TPA: hypothetical protein PKK83_05240 [Polyangiaceae bacterium]|jgi:hypothetical protein|nr:MAG: hypothetical protein BWY17_01638 [Deltaproteobacteria bacterium ADurb.Bin207]HOD21673.1 hypothetical protein [Polyangiaceae bacterium]HOE48168.1 hypothetical protein [Polyangiaceae bacterium]HOR35761.1 hypothetical protein [Polyangiaceae bacterium]HQB42741.1 hypothetical protein [Polyangiaceae bacterium]